MSWLLKKLWWFVLVLIILPVAAGSAWSYAKGWPSGWNSADWSSSHTIPDPRTDRPAMIRIYAARSGRWKGIFAVHHWIVVKRQGSLHYDRYEVVGWGRPVRLNNYAPDARWYSNPPQIVHELRGAQADALIGKVEQAVASYQWQRYGSYHVWPGPNSNTFVAHVLRSVPELGAEMLPTGIGKDFIKPGLAFANMPSGTGWQVSLWGLAGAGLSLREGLELHVLGATIGIDPDDLAVKLPALGKIGLL